MRTCLAVVVALTVVVSAGCKSSSQTPGDGGPADTADDHLVGPEINLGSDARDAGDARDGADAPPACTGPRCPVVLATDSDPSCCVVVDGTYVYWVSFSGSSWSIMRVPGAGGTPEYFEYSEFLVGDMAIKDGVLYWTASGRCLPARSRRRARQRDKDRVGLIERWSRSRVDGNSVYWADVRQPDPQGAAGRRHADRRRRPAPTRCTSPPTVRTFTGRTSRCRAVRS